MSSSPRHRLNPIESSLPKQAQIYQCNQSEACQLKNGVSKYVQTLKFSGVLNEDIQRLRTESNQSQKYDL